jgi:predicted Zn finger-like uncharacterized protein
MILSCNSCNKKFVVPDQAIKDEGRIVQCGSCGNKWKQFPDNKEKTKTIDVEKNNIKKIPKSIKTTKSTKKKINKKREINLYSPEYLEKKHGISLKEVKNKKIEKLDNRVSFGFYNSLIIFIVVAITLSKGLHFFQGFIVQSYPFTEFYLDYFFESIKNIFEILKNLTSNY